MESESISFAITLFIRQINFKLDYIGIQFYTYSKTGLFSYSLNFQKDKYLQGRK